MDVRGVVVSGLGEGKQYVPRYLPLFEAQLGITCYPGTLNVRMPAKPQFDTSKKITITPAEGSPVDCYMVIIDRAYDGAIVIPHKTDHDPMIIEIISPVNLREELHLKDGDEIQCELV